MTLFSQCFSVEEILCSPSILKVVYNLQVALLPIFASLKSIPLPTMDKLMSRSKYNVQNLFDVRCAASLLCSDLKEDELELIPLYRRFCPGPDDTADHDHDHSASVHMGSLTRMIASLCDEMKYLRELYRVQHM